MRDSQQLTEDDEGKAVHNANGENIGRVMEVERGTAHVKPDPGLADDIRAKLGWGEGDEDTYRLRSEDIDTIGDAAVRLSR
jgi:hypothetical protein